MDAAVLSCVLRDSFMSPASLATPHGARLRPHCFPSPQRIRVPSATRCDACSAMNPSKYPSPLSVARAAARVGLLLLSVGLLLPASHCAAVPPPPDAAAQPAIAAAIDAGLATNTTVATSPDVNTTTAKPPPGAAGGNPPPDAPKNGNDGKKVLANPQPPGDLPKKPAPADKAPEAPIIAVDTPKTDPDGKTTTPPTTIPTTTATSTTLPTTSRPPTTPAKAAAVDGKLPAADPHPEKAQVVAPHPPPAGDDEKEEEGSPGDKETLEQETVQDFSDTGDEAGADGAGKNRNGGFPEMQQPGKEPAAPPRRGGTATEDDGQNHAFGYFVVVLVGCVAVIAFWRKRQRILAYLIEGRRSNGRRRTASRTGAAQVQYRKLKTADED